MTTTELLKQFADPNVIQSLSITDKLIAGLITTLMGMGITFIALIILQIIISWMDRLLNRTATAAVPAPLSASVAPETTPAAPANLQDDQELVAVLTTAIAMQLKTSVGNIVIRNIEKIEDRSPAWNRAGIIEQMNSRF